MLDSTLSDAVVLNKVFVSTGGPPPHAASPSVGSRRPSAECIPRTTACWHPVDGEIWVCVCVCACQALVHHGTDRISMCFVSCSCPPWNRQNTWLSLDTCHARDGHWRHSAHGCCTPIRVHEVGDVHGRWLLMYFEVSRALRCLTLQQQVSCFKSLSIQTELLLIENEGGGGALAFSQQSMNACISPQTEEGPRLGGGSAPSRAGPGRGRTGHRYHPNLCEGRHLPPTPALVIYINIYIFSQTYIYIYIYETLPVGTKIEKAKDIFMIGRQLKGVLRVREATSCA